MDKAIEFKGEYGGKGQDNAVGASILFMPFGKLVIRNNIAKVQFEVNEVENNKKTDGCAGTVESHRCRCVVVLPVHELEAKENNPSGHLNECYQCTKNSLKMHIFVKTSKNSSNNDDQN